MNKHILIVDDEAAIRDLLAQFLGANGYRVTPVASATEAEKAIERDPPQLIISDLQLEESDGLDLVTQLKARLPDVPIILLTGVLFDPEVVRGVLSHKVSIYLEKTTPLARILVEVRSLIG